jgi:hypothetical protein
LLLKCTYGFPLINFEQVHVLCIGLHVDSAFSGYCVAQYSQFRYYRVSVTRIGYIVTDEKVNAMCITQNSAYTLLTVT